MEKKTPSTKYEIEKFTGVNDFSLSHLKMQALLVQKGLLEALKGYEKMDVSLTEKKKTMMIKKVRNAIVLSLGGKVLRQVSKAKIADGVWMKLKGLYMTKSFVNRLYLKQALYSFKVSEDKVLAEKLDIFNKLILDLENIEVKTDDEDQALLLLSVKGTFTKKYGRFENKKGKVLQNSYGGNVPSIRCYHFKA